MLSKLPFTAGKCVGATSLKQMRAFAWALGYWSKMQMHYMKRNTTIGTTNRSHKQDRQAKEISTKGCKDAIVQETPGSDFPSHYLIAATLARTPLRQWSSEYVSAVLFDVSRKKIER